MWQVEFQCNKGGERMVRPFVLMEKAVDFGSLHNMTIVNYQFD